MGMNNQTGKTITGIAWLRQRLADVLSTSLGSRLMRRDYGSRLSELVDQPMSPRWKVQIYAAVVEVINNPVNGLAEITINQANVTINSKGKAVLDVWANYTPTGESLRFEAIEVN